MAKKTSRFKKYMRVAAAPLIGAVIGIAISMLVFASPTEDMGAGDSFLRLMLVFAQMLAAAFLQIIIHESGHLVFGLLTGYRFSSFRIGGIMLAKQEGHLKLKRLSIAGTGGQCLMLPPENGKMPFMLYNLGGPIFNLVSALAFFLLAFLFKETVYYLYTFLLLLSLLGLAFGLLNGIPMKLNLVNNDGYNALTLGKDEKALRAFYMQLRIAGLVASGVRLKDMPDEWFFLSDLRDNLSATMDAFAANRLMDMHRFDEADELMKKLLAVKSLAGLHKNMLVCDRMYCALISEDKKATAASMMNSNQKKFMVAMRKFPSVLRTQHAIALLLENDKNKASDILAAFEKVAKNYPYASDIESERELINIAGAIANSSLK